MSIKSLKETFTELTGKVPNPQGEFFASTKETALFRIKFNGRIETEGEEETLEELDEPFYESQYVKNPWCPSKGGEVSRVCS